jgi:hypothetical protein
MAHVHARCGRRAHAANSFQIFFYFSRQPSCAAAGHSCQASRRARQLPRGARSAARRTQRAPARRHAQFALAACQVAGPASERLRAAAAAGPARHPPGTSLPCLASREGVREAFLCRVLQACDVGMGEHVRLYSVGHVPAHSQSPPRAPLAADDAEPLDDPMVSPPATPRETPQHESPPPCLRSMRASGGPTPHISAPDNTPKDHAGPDPGRHAAAAPGLQTEPALPRQEGPTTRRGAGGGEGSGRGRGRGRGGAGGEGALETRRTCVMAFPAHQVRRRRKHNLSGPPVSPWGWEVVHLLLAIACLALGC